MRLSPNYFVYLLSFSRQVPAWETMEVAAYLARLFSCDMDSLPTELLVHSYWTLMPRQFGSAGSYIRCLRTRTRRYTVRTCENISPHYCGRRFGEQAAVDRLTVCRQLMVGRETFNYSVPQPVRSKAGGYRACLARTRNSVPLSIGFWWRLTLGFDLERFFVLVLDLGRTECMRCGLLRSLIP